MQIWASRETPPVYSSSTTDTTSKARHSSQSTVLTKKQIEITPASAPVLSPLSQPTTTISVSEPGGKGKKDSCLPVVDPAIQPPAPRHVHGLLQIPMQHGSPTSLLVKRPFSKCRSVNAFQSLEHIDNLRHRWPFGTVRIHAD